MPLIVVLDASVTSPAWCSQVVGVLRDAVADARPAMESWTVRIAESVDPHRTHGTTTLEVQRGTEAIGCLNLTLPHNDVSARLVYLHVRRLVCDALPMRRTAQLNAAWAH